MRLFLGGKLLNQIQSATVMLLGLVVGIKLRGVVTRLDQVLDRAFKVSSQLEMHGQLCGNVGRLLAVMLQQLLARLPVQQYPAFAYQIAIEHVLV